MNTESEQIERLPVLPLRDVVIFPSVVVPLYVGRAFSVAAITKAEASKGKQVLLVSQRQPEVDAPTADDLYQIGCVAKVLQKLILTDGSVKILVEGGPRVKLTNMKAGRDGMLSANYVEQIETNLPDDKLSKVLRNKTFNSFNKLARFTRAEIPTETVVSAGKIEEISRFTDFIVFSMKIEVAKRQEFLEILSIKDRIDMLITVLERELEVNKIERKLRGRVKNQIEKHHREYYLNEKAKAIQQELGDEGAQDTQDLEEQIEKAGMPEAVYKKCKSELRKLTMAPSMSPESAVLRTYLETLVKLPWSKRSEVNHDLIRAREVLDEDHYGLEKVKERIIEHLAVQLRVKNPIGTILCIVGPPGVGKTSLGKSIARATDREFVRMALGGVRDEAEIRGHRRTYVASMPGRILHCMTRAGTRNPVFMLDEVDKMGYDMRGDPASALLEVLDPEQNCRFMDHYAEVDFDLSEVLFIATSNTFNIPPALLDRLDVIPISGYTEQEKTTIAQDHLIPKAKENTGIPVGKLQLREQSLHEIIRSYTREAGVRQLEREILKICRKVVTNQVIVSNQQQRSKVKKTASKVAKPSKFDPDKMEFSKQLITPKQVRKLLGVQRYTHGRAKSESRIGQVAGLAWTETGGEMLNIEAITVPGKGKTVRTGKLGEVMKESIEAAHSVVRSRATALDISDEMLRERDIHIHLPEGAIPKDGPSAGVGVVCAMVSALTEKPMRGDVAMTGEITLRGEVLPIGGVKEKLLAAVRAGIKHVLLPEENRKDLEEINADLLKNIEIHFITWIDQVLEFSLGIAAINRTKTKKPKAVRKLAIAGRRPNIAPPKAN